MTLKLQASQTQKLQNLTHFQWDVQLLQAEKVQIFIIKTIVFKVNFLIVLNNNIYTVIILSSNLMLQHHTCVNFCICTISHIIISNCRKHLYSYISLKFYPCSFNCSNLEFSTIQNIGYNYFSFLC